MAWCPGLPPLGGPHPAVLPLPQVVGNQLLYENQLVSDIDVRMGPQGSITRDGAFR